MSVVTGIRRRQVILNGLTHATMILVSLLVIFPFLWMVSISLRNNLEIFTTPIHWIPKIFTLDAYKEILTSMQHRRALMNSYFVALLTTLASVTLASLAGYGYSRFNFPGKRATLMFILSVQIIPPMLLAIPYFLLSVAYNIYDSYLALVVTYTSFSLPFATLMLRSYFATIPRELEEAAIIDGCTRLGALIRVILPVSLPGIIATAVYTFVLAWNELLFALTLTEGWKRRTVPVSIGFLMGEFTSEWNQIMALSVIASVPIVALFLFLQKHLIQGMTAGAMKG